MGSIPINQENKFLCIYHYLKVCIGLNFNQTPFSGVIINDLLLNLIGMSVFSHGSTSYLVKSSVSANFISISANRFPKVSMTVILLNYIFLGKHCASLRKTCVQAKTDKYCLITIVTNLYITQVHHQTAYKFHQAFQLFLLVRTVQGRMSRDRDNICSHDEQHTLE